MTVSASHRPRACGGGAQVQVHVLQAEEEADDLVASLQEALQDHIASLGPAAADSRCCPLGRLTD